MFILKIILGLILAIAVGAIFTDNMGDGYFDFQKKAKAEAFTNKVDDISAVMQTYKISKVDTVSVVEALETNDPAPIDVTMDNIVTELTKDEVKLLKGDASVDLGELTVGTHVANGQEGVYLVLVGEAGNKQISDEICLKINENITGTELTAAEMTANYGKALGAVATTAKDAVYDATDLFTAIGVHDVVGGKVEGACFLDTDGAGNNAFVYYVQEK